MTQHCKTTECHISPTRVQLTTSITSTVDTGKHVCNTEDQRKKEANFHTGRSVEDALVHSGLRTLVARREDLCKSFMHKLRSNNINVNNNPVAHLINNLSQGHEHNYQLRTQPINPPFTRTGNQFMFRSLI